MLFKQTTISTSPLPPLSTPPHPIHPPLLPSILPFTHELKSIRVHVVWMGAQTNALIGRGAGGY